MKREYKITEKRQITLPDEILEAIGAEVGDKITYRIRGDTVIVRKLEGEERNAAEIAEALEDLSEDLSQIKPELEKARKGIRKGIAEKARGEG